MPTYPVQSIVDGQPTFGCKLSEILLSLQVGGALKVLTPIEYHTDRQRRWYKGICIKGLSDWSGDTVDEWDSILKVKCGREIIKPRLIVLQGAQLEIPGSITSLGKRKMTRFIENILSESITQGWPVTPPDSDLRRK